MTGCMRYTTTILSKECIQRSEHHFVDLILPDLKVMTCVATCHLRPGLLAVVPSVAVVGGREARSTVIVFVASFTEEELAALSEDWAAL